MIVLIKIDNGNEFENTISQSSKSRNGHFLKQNCFRTLRIWICKKKALTFCVFSICLAYAQHSLQHVIAMLSWLVELIDSSLVLDVFQDSTVADEDFRILPAKVCWIFFSLPRLCNIFHLFWVLVAFLKEELPWVLFVFRITLTFLPKCMRSGTFSNPRTPLWKSSKRGLVSKPTYNKYFMAP